MGLQLCMRGVLAGISFAVAGETQLYVCLLKTTSYGVESQVTDRTCGKSGWCAKM